MKKFLIINPFGIGDVLFTTPVVKAIRRAYPDSHIGYWCNDRARDILKNNPNIDKIFALSRGDLKKIFSQSRLAGISKFLSLLHKIKKGKFEICLDFSLDHRYSLISKLLGIKKRCGFNYKKRGRFLTDRIDIDCYAQKHVVEYYCGLLKFIKVTPETKNLDLYVTSQGKIKAAGLFKKLGINDKGLIIGIAPGAGASWGKDAGLKHWPAIKFAQLADKLINELKAQVLILADALEVPITEKIVSAMQNKPVDLTGKTSLEELIAVINNLEILVTNDGGPLHIAAALGKKTVSFFGPVDPKVYGPYPENERRHIVLSKALGCSPCYRNFQINPCQRNKECLKAISMEEAFLAVNRLLG